MFDGKAFGEEMVSVVRSYVDRVAAPLIAENKTLVGRVDSLSAQIAALEARAAIPGERGKDGRDGADGKDGERGEPGQAGADGQNGLDGADGKDGIDGRNGADGKDGAGIADLLIDRAGELVATFTDGRVKSLGPVVGRDGRDGVDGKDGERGADGLGPDHLKVEQADDGRTIRLSLREGETFELRFPVVLDRGVFKEGEHYAQGDAVSWGGSVWIAQRSTDEKPDGPNSGWRLAVKRGRDGKDRA